jgi:poly-beta-1,6-N-acetyl-D-glucosamine synthase
LVEISGGCRRLRYTVIAPSGCRLTTEVMETWRELYRQRLRWNRGALENRGDYPLTRVTARYWAGSASRRRGSSVTLAYLGSLV